MNKTEILFQNDFICICPRGYFGRYCQDTQFCELTTCPGQGVCQNLEFGFECITNVTFQGEDVKPLAFTFNQRDEMSTKPMSGTIEISFRTKTGGTLLYVQNQRKYFQIAVFKNQVTLSWNLTSDLPEIRRFAQENLSYDWQTLIINVQDNLLKANFKGYEEAYDTGVQQSATAEINQQEFINLFSGVYSYYLILIFQKNSHLSI